MTKASNSATTILIDPEFIHSFVEGGLWSMRLLKEHEHVVNVAYNNTTDKYEVTTVASADQEQAELPW